MKAIQGHFGDGYEGHGGEKTPTTAQEHFNTVQIANAKNNVVNVPATSEELEAGLLKYEQDKIDNAAEKVSDKEIMKNSLMSAFKVNETELEELKAWLKL